MAALQERGAERVPTAGRRALRYLRNRYLDLRRAYSGVERCGPEKSHRSGKSRGMSWPTSMRSSRLTTRKTAAAAYHG